MGWVSIDEASNLKFYSIFDFIMEIHKGVYDITFTFFVQNFTFFIFLFAMFFVAAFIRGIYKGVNHL